MVISWSMSNLAMAIPLKSVSHVMSRRQHFHGTPPTPEFLNSFYPVFCNILEAVEDVTQMIPSGRSVQQSLLFSTSHVMFLRLEEVGYQTCRTSAMIWTGFQWFSRNFVTSNCDPPLVIFFFRFYFYLRGCMLVWAYGELIWWLLLAFAGFRHTHGWHT